MKNLKIQTKYHSRRNQIHPSFIFHEKSALNNLFFPQTNENIAGNKLTASHFLLVLEFSYPACPTLYIISSQPIKNFFKNFTGRVLILFSESTIFPFVYILLLIIRVGFVSPHELQ